MEEFLRLIQSSDDRNFLLAVKYSNIIELAQERLDQLAEKKKKSTVQQTTPVKSIQPSPLDDVSNSVTQNEVRPHHGNSSNGDDDASTHNDHPPSAISIESVAQLNKVLQENAEKFTVVKLGASWCKPCTRVRVHLPFHSIFIRTLHVYGLLDRLPQHFTTLLRTTKLKILFTPFVT